MISNSKLDWRGAENVNKFCQLVGIDLADTPEEGTDGCLDELDRGIKRAIAPDHPCNYKEEAQNLINVTEIFSQITSMMMISETPSSGRPQTRLQRLSKSILLHGLITNQIIEVFTERMLSGCKCRKP